MDGNEDHESEHAEYQAQPCENHTTRGAGSVGPATRKKSTTWNTQGERQHSQRSLIDALGASRLHGNRQHITQANQHEKNAGDIHARHPDATTRQDRRRDDGFGGTALLGNTKGGAHNEAAHK